MRQVRLWPGIGGISLYVGEGAAFMLHDPLPHQGLIEVLSDTAPSYRQAFKKRRCLIPVDGFYEWKKVLGSKIPYSISMKDDSPSVFAGLWEGWKDPANGEWLHTCTIITGEPNAFVREIHTRMPVILPEDHHDSWLTGGNRCLHR
jgi:putative SOS response-associated peptidase YedK